MLKFMTSHHFIKSYIYPALLRPLSYVTGFRLLFGGWVGGTQGIMKWGRKPSALLSGLLRGCRAVCERACGTPQPQRQQTSAAAFQLRPSCLCAGNCAT